MKIIGIYKITNIVNGDSYIGSSNNVKRRWREHKCTSRWNEHPNSQLYHDFQKYGIDKFVFEVIAEVEEDSLKEMEQRFIEKLHPTYNQMNAKGLDVERKKEYKKEYEKTDKRKKAKKEYNNQLCCYNGEKLTLCALATRFQKAGIPHPQIEAKKYLLNK